MQTGQVRGAHGSGMFTVSTEGYVRNQSLAVPGTGFLMDKRAEEVLQSTREARIVVGHNRFTTSGQNINDHCHPFRFEHLVGVHNGGIGDNILKRIDPKVSHDVDSARIFAALNDTENPLDVLTQVHSGAYCLVWYDGRKRSLFLTRNSQRPMHIAETTTGLYFASELGMLSWLLGRDNKTGYGNIPMSRLDPMTLYEIPLDDPSQVSATPYEAPYVYNRPAVAEYIPPLPGYREPGNANLHKYYSGHGIFGGVAAPVAYKRYYGENGLIRDFPCTKVYLDTLELLETNGAIYPQVPMLLLGLGKDVMGEDCAFGLLSTDDGLTQYTNMLMSVRIRTDAERDLLTGLLAAGMEGDASEWSFPVIPAEHRALLLRPTGELIISAELPRDFGEDEITECMWVFDMDHRMTPWVKAYVGPTCLTNLAPEQLVSAWADLKAGKTQVSPNEDIPW
jgi:hypothetical protein